MEGAGTPCCNGIYRVSADVAENVNVPTVAGPKGSEEDAPKYTHQAEGFPLLTLFRCKMRTKAYWWFIRWAGGGGGGGLVFVWVALFGRLI